MNFKNAAGLIFFLGVMIVSYAQEGAEGSQVQPQGGNDFAEAKDCEQKESGILDDRDLLLVSLSRAIDIMAENLTEAEQDLLADLLDNDTCPDEKIEEAIELYKTGTLYPGRAKRGYCQSQKCRKGYATINCSGRCKCKCNWLGKPKCRCCNQFDPFC